MPPRILVSTDTNADKFRNYVLAVEKAGGEVVPVRDGDDPADAARKAMAADGWLLIGGRDLPPRDEPLHSKADLLTDSRLDIENAIHDAAADADMPILGICMGAQFMNWKAGGPMYQHIPDMGVTAHGAQSTTDEPTIVRVSPDSMLAGALGATRVSARCHHHQAIREVGKGYKAVAWDNSDERIIEGIEDAGGKWRIGVQWHPERTPEVESDSLFKAFVNACANRS